jgi:two-component system LytT family response regulator
MLLQKNNTATAIADTALQADTRLSRIVVKENGKIKIIPVTQIHYLEAADDYIKIHAADGIFLKKKTMQYFEDSLPKQEFIRVHRSYIVHTQLITRIDLLEKESYSLLLTTGARLPVSKTGYTKLKSVLGL